MEKLGLSATYSQFTASREHLMKHVPTSPDDLPPRSMQDSFTSAIIPLSSDISLREKYLGFLGNVRIGRLMEDMDMFAVWVVHQHISLPNLEPGVHVPYTFVTSVYQIIILN